MPDIVHHERTEKIVPSPMQFTPYLMVEPVLATALVQAGLIHRMTDDAGNTVYPVMDGISLEHVKTWIRAWKKGEVPPPDAYLGAPFDGFAPIGPEAHVQKCGKTLKILRKKLMLVTETECPVHGRKTNITTVPDELAQVGMVAIAEASKAKRGEPLFTSMDFNTSLN